MVRCTVQCCVVRCEVGRGGGALGEVGMVPSGVVVVVVVVGHLLTGEVGCLPHQGHGVTRVEGKHLGACRASGARGCRGAGGGGVAVRCGT